MPQGDERAFVGREYKDRTIRNFDAYQDGVRDGHVARREEKEDRYLTVLIITVVVAIRLGQRSKSC